MVLGVVAVEYEMAGWLVSISDRRFCYRDRKFSSSFSRILSSQIFCELDIGADISSHKV